MKTETLISFVLVMTFGLTALFLAVPPVYAVTTTITGYNVPNAANYVNGFFALVIPLMFAEIFGGILFALKRGGDFYVSLFLMGLAIGSSFGTMAGQIPIAMSIIAWVLLVLWWWTGGQGEGSGASGDLSLPRGF